MLEDERNGIALQLSKTMIGCAVLSFPYVLRICGAVFGVSLILLCATLTVFSCELLLMAGENTGTSTYGGIAERLFGKKADALVCICISLYCFGSMVAILSVSSDTLSSLLLTISGNSLFQRTPIMFLCFLIVMLLSSMSNRRIGDTVNQLSNFVYIFFSGVLIYLAYYSDWISVKGSSIASVSEEPEIFSYGAYYKPSGFFSGFPIIAYGFGCQQSLFIIGRFARDPGSVSFGVRHGVIMTSLFYMFVAIFGYFIEYSDTSSNVLLNMPNTSSVSIFGKMCFCTSLVTTSALVVSPGVRALDGFKVSLLSEFPILDNIVPPVSESVLKVCFVSSAFMTAVLVTRLDLVLGLLGATTSIMVCFLFPALFFLGSLQLSGNERLSNPITKLFAVALIAFSLAMGFISTQSIISQIT